MGVFGLTPEDFKQLPKDGARFEALVCQLLEAMEYRILEKPAVGVEGGRDVLVERTLKDAMGERREKVVVQCKHYAHSGRAIGDKDAGVWQNAMTRYSARGYLLVTDTRVTENLSRSFRAFTDDEANFPKWATFWDVDDLIHYLYKHQTVRDTFFPPDGMTPTPLEDLTIEVRTWLQAIRYKVSEPRQPDDRTLEMVAKLDEGTVKQTVLVRCIGGEIAPTDVDAMDAVLDRKTPQGWLISDTRVSNKARERAAEDDAFQVLNLSEFLQEKIWGRYFDQLTSLVEEARIPELYVDASCNKIDVNEEGHQIHQDGYDSLDEYIDQWLTERGKMHISLLGEFGAGKTWFCRHYAYRQLERYLKDPVKERLPLLITLRQFTKALTSQQLINEALMEQYELPFVGSAFDVFQEMNRRGKLLLILDGFDEMARQVDYQTVVDNFWELAELVEEKSKVILTSRTEYFRWAKESEKILGGEEFGRRTIELSPPKFEVLHLSPFSDNQIREVITKRLGADEGKAVAERILGMHNLAEMARKPILIELLLAALDEVSADVLENPAQVYLYATNRLLLRNIDTERTFTSTADKLYFLCELAWEMIRDGELRIHYTEIPERIKTYFGERIKDQHELDTWDYDLRNQTLLHRDVAGYYEFAHKSLAEYFVAFKFAAELGCLAPEFMQTYCEANGQPCELQNIKKDPDFSILPLPQMNFETAKFFAEMAGGMLAESLPSFTGTDTIAKEFGQVREHLTNLLKLKAQENIVNLPRIALQIMTNLLGAHQGTIRVIFRDAFVFYSDTAEGNPFANLKTELVHSIVSQALNQSPLYYSVDRSQDFPVARSFIGLPISVENKVIAVCSIRSDDKARFIESDSQAANKFGIVLGAYIGLLGRFRESWQKIERNGWYTLVPSLSIESSENLELDQEMEWSIEGEKRKGTLLAYFAERELVLAEEQIQKLAKSESQ